MTQEEFDIEIRRLNKHYLSCDDDKCDYYLQRIYNLQSKFMEELLENYKQCINGNQAKEVIYEALVYAVNDSLSGSVIIGIDSKELAEEVDDIYWSEIGDYLLDGYVYESDGNWCLDCMFAGNYVPYWDGWTEQREQEG